MRRAGRRTWRRQGRLCQAELARGEQVRRYFAQDPLFPSNPAKLNEGLSTHENESMELRLSIAASQPFETLASERVRLTYQSRICSPVQNSTSGRDWICSSASRK